MLAHSFSVRFLEGLNLSLSDVATVSALAEHKGRQKLFEKRSPEVLDKLVFRAKIESVESSNRIEGIEISSKRAVEIIEKHSTPQDRSEQEIAGYRDALALIHDSASDMRFSPNLLLQLHSVLYRYLPGGGGRWKSTNNDIIETYPDGTKRVRFHPTPAHLTSEAIEQLIREYDSQTLSNNECLVIVPLAVLDFLCIHPFHDGNGRIGRLLTNLLLYQHAFGVGRFISLERIIEQSKETYYEALEASSRDWHDSKHDPLPWLRYFWGMLQRAYSEFEARIGQTDPGYGAKTRRVREVVLKKGAPFSIADIEEECPGISREVIRSVLRALRDEGKLLAPRGGRHAKWAPQ